MNNSNLAAVPDHSLPEAQGNGFDLRPRNFDEAMKIATMIANSQLAPKDFKGKADDTMVAMMMGQELGLNPMQSIQNIAVINGRPSIWGDALLALVQNHPKFQSIAETIDETNMIASCTVQRKGGEPHTSTFSRADAETAGLWGRNTWKQYPKRMLAMRARGFALRNQFADALSGLVTREEAMDMPVDELIVLNPNVGAAQAQPKAEPEAVLLPEYPEEMFKKKLSGRVDLMTAGEKTADDIINMIETKYTMTEGQKKDLRSFG